MQITIDTDASVVRVRDNETTAEYFLFSPEAFHLLSRQWLVLGWNLEIWRTFSWMGQQMCQLPADALRLAELFWRLKPDVIVETGVYYGGSTLLFASLCRLQGKGRVISVDCEFRPGVHEAIQEGGGGLVTMIQGDSSRPETALEVRRNIQPDDRVCVFLDAAHTFDHVAAELRHLAPLVTPGCYMIVADTNLADLAHTPLGKREWSWNNPGKAMDEFLTSHPEFCRETPSSLFSVATDFRHLSYFPNSWLRRL